MPVTCLSIVNRALEHIQIKGAEESSGSPEADLALRSLSSFLDAMQTEPHAIVGLTELTFTPAGGAQTVTIGPTGCDITADVPVRISPASFVRNGGVDEPLIPLHSFDQYTHQGSKDVQSIPEHFFYRREPTKGTLYLYPAADGNSELHMWVPQEVVTGQTALALASSLTLPSGYRYWLEYALAAEIAPTFEVPPALVGLMQQRATNALRRIKRANVTIPQLSTGLGRPYWDINEGD